MPRNTKRRQPNRKALLTAAIAVAVGGIVVAVRTATLIPFHEPLLGLDFQNVHAFNNCPDVWSNTLYTTGGSICGDALGRDFNYPPAIFYAFTWVRHLSFEFARSMWSVAATALMVSVGIAWLSIDQRLSERRRAAALVGVWLLLVIQFPFTFALERGNNDVLPLALWTAAALAYTRLQHFPAGVLAGLSIATKVYPAVAVMSIVPGVIRAGTRTRWLALGGLIVGLGITFALWPQDTVDYLTISVPRFATQDAQHLPYGHALGSLPFGQLTSLVAVGGLLCLWAFASWRRLRDSPSVVMAGAIAISTYFSAVSWDYNLITVYPLILLVVARAIDREASRLWIAAAGMLATSFFVARGLVPGSIHVTLQIASLAFVAWILIIGEDRRRAEKIYPEDRGLLTNTPSD